MFKRSLAAVAVLGVMAGVASAGSVTLYGKLDTGMAWTRTKAGDASATSSFEMGSGYLSGSRLGVKGSEDLGNGMSVGFKLEGNVTSTNGDTKLFKRETTLNLSGPFGTVYVGRMGTLRSSAGSVGIGNIDPLGAGSVIGGWGNLLDDVSSRLDNTVAYVSPEFGGAKIYGQYSMGSEGVQNKSQSKNRYMGLGATFDNGPLSLTAVVDSYLEPKADGSKNEYAFTFGGSYDFEAVKPSLQLAYFKNGKELAVKDYFAADAGLFTGLAAQVGAEIPAGPGSVIASLGYGHATSKVAGVKMYKYDTLNLGVAYTYPMSKRTKLYVGAGYLNTKQKAAEGSASMKASVYQGAFGLVHSF